VYRKGERGIFIIVLLHGKYTKARPMQIQASDKASMQPGERQAVVVRYTATNSITKANA